MDFHPIHRSAGHILVFVYLLVRGGQRRAQGAGGQVQSGPHPGPGFPNLDGDHDTVCSGGGDFAGDFQHLRLQPENAPAVPPAKQLHQQFHP